MIPPTAFASGVQQTCRLATDQRGVATELHFRWATPGITVESEAMLKKRTRRPHLLLLALMSLLAQGTAFATTGTTADPLENVSTLHLEFMVGGALRAEPSIALELFGGSVKRADALQVSIQELLQNQFASAGIQLKPSGALGSAQTRHHYLSIRLFGRPLGPDFQSIFLLEMELGAYPDPESSSVSWSRTVLGAAADSSLESEITAAARSVIDQLLHDHEARRPPSVAGDASNGPTSIGGREILQ